MFKKFLTLFIAVTFVVFAGVPKQHKAKVANESVVIESNAVVGPTVQATQGPQTFKATGDPAVGVEIGTTDYDYGWNSGWSRQIAQHGNGADIHMTFQERNTLLASPNNRRVQKYVYYKTSDGSMVKAYPRPASVGASGFGGVDVISNGPGENTAVMVYHTPNFFAVDGGPGLGQFSESAIPANIPDAVLDPEITWDAGRQMLWYYDTKNRTDYNIAKSTDFGATWVYVDSLLKYAPKGQIQGGLDNPVLVAPNGDLYLTTTLTGTGSIPPSGTSAADSSDLIGYFKSTDAGATWAWTTWGHDGDRLIVGTDTVYVQFENFGGLCADVDDNNVLHMAVNGYALKVINDSTAENYFYTLYKHTGMADWKVISKPADARVADFDTYVYNGNAFGFAYPSITVGGNTVFSAWSQPRVTAGKVDTSYNGICEYDLFYSYSNDNGATWTTSTKLSNSNGGLFTTMADRMSINGSLATAHVLYLADTSAGSVVFDGVTSQQTPYIYRTITVSTGTSVGESGISPESFELAQNYPNPFNPSTTIKFNLPATAQTSLKVFNMLGQEVATLVNGVMNSGAQAISFDASKFSSGVYIYKLQSGSFSASKKMVLTK